MQTQFSYGFSSLNYIISSKKSEKTVCKGYELSNHLGNVLSVISDLVIPHQSTTNTGVVDYYLASVLQAQDYSPFGVTLKGRNFKKTGSSEDFRFGFNGMEADDEIKGNGNSYDFGARMYDSRLGRWLTVDPLLVKYMSYSPYNFVRNNPIIRIDIEGKTDFYFNGKFIGTDGIENGKIGLVKNKDVKKQIKKNEYKYPTELTDGNYPDFIIIDYNVLEVSNKILDLSLSKGQIKEFGAILLKDEKGRYNINSYGILEGPDAPWENSNPGTVKLEGEQVGQVSIHSHRTSMAKDGRSASPDTPSPADKSSMDNETLSIIVGKEGDCVQRPDGVIEDNRPKFGAIDFYDKNNKSKAIISLNGIQAKKILKHQTKN